MRFLAWLAALSLGTTISSQSFGSEDLLSLYREAQETSAGYRASQAGAQAEMESESIALGQLLPSLGLSGNYGKNETDRNIGNAATENFNYESSTYNLNFRQPIYRKYNYALYQQAKAQGEGAASKLNQALNELIVRLSSAYLEALYANDQLALLDAQKMAIAAQVKASEKGMIAGSGTRIDIDEARARYDLVQAQELEAENRRRDTLRILSGFINREVAELRPLNINSFNPRPPNPPDVNTWLALAEANNTEYQVLQSQVKAAEHEVEKALAGHYPTLDLVASGGRSTNDNLSNLNNRGNTEYKTTNYGLQVNVPLFAGWQVNATVRQARRKLEQVQMQAEEMRRNLGIQTRREFDNVVQGIAKVKALERAETSGRQMVASNKRGIEGGVRSTIDALLAEQQLFTARRDLAQARYSFLIATLKLKSLSGLLGEADVDELNKQLTSIN